MPKYLLEIDSEQAQIISKACELYARLHLGQLRVLVEEFIGRMDCEKFWQLRDGMKSLEYLITGFPNNSYQSIVSPSLSDCAKTAWDIYQVVRHKIVWTEHPEPKNGFRNVNYDEPLQTSMHPLPNIWCPASHNPWVQYYRYSKGEKP